MGGAASLAQVPNEILSLKDLAGAQVPQLTKLYLNDLRRLSRSNVNSARTPRLTYHTRYEIPSSILEFLKKLEIDMDVTSTRQRSSTQAGNSPGGGTFQSVQTTQTTRLISHIFECLVALQHVVRANQSGSVPDGDETQSVYEGNVQALGSLVHEMVSIYGLCGDTLEILISNTPEAAFVEDKFGRLPIHVAVDREEPWTHVSAPCMVVVYYFHCHSPL